MTATTTQRPDTRSAYLPVRIRPAGLAHIDRARGSWTRSEYVREALALAARQQLRGPK